jgi:hypothetical protein
VRASEAIIRITENENPPEHLVLGAFGVEAVTNKLRTTLAEIEAWRETSLATDYPST